jgi:acetyl esterase/lipase
MGQDMTMTYAYDPELAVVIPHLPWVDDPRDVAATRTSLSAMLAEMPPPDTTGVQIEDRRISGRGGDPDVPIRIYRPQRASAPAAVYDVHGGGFIAGDLEFDHTLNVTLTRELGVVVVSVDYRLAPETPFPGPLEDLYAGLVWTASTPTSSASTRSASPSTASAPVADCARPWRCSRATAADRKSPSSSYPCRSSTTGSPRRA